MTNTQPDVAPGGYYNGVETAKALGICRRSLCYYRKRLLINPVLHRPTMRYRYKGSEIIRFWKDNIKL